MNKLEEYRANKAQENGMSTPKGRISDYENGFDAAIALDLPVKFHNWISKVHSNFDTWEKVANKIAKKEAVKGNPTTQQFFSYWLNNIWEGV